MLSQLFFRRVLQICTLRAQNKRPLKSLFFNEFRLLKFAVRNKFEVSLTGNKRRNIRLVGEILAS